MNAAPVEEAKNTALTLRFSSADFLRWETLAATGFHWVGILIPSVKLQKDYVDQEMSSEPPDKISKTPLWSCFCLCLQPELSEAGGAVLQQLWDNQTHFNTKREKMAPTWQEGYGLRS